MIEGRFRMIEVIAEKAQSLNSIYEPYLYKEGITATVGDPGVCKTTVGYALGMKLSEGEKFLGISPGRPIKVLLLDFESGDSLIKLKYEQMGEGKSYPNLRVYNGVDALYPTLRMEFDELYQVFPFEFMLIDNLGSAFGLRDENDNAEAEGYIKMLRADCRAYDCAIMIYHHPSKANLKGTRKGSGAFAWARYCDVYLNLNLVEDEEGMVEIEIAKHRLSENVGSKFFRKMGSGYFEECQPPLGYSHQGVKYPVDQVCESILNKHGVHKRVDLLAITTQKGWSNELLGKALEKLVREKRIKRGPDYGFYTIP